MSVAFRLIAIVVVAVMMVGNIHPAAMAQSMAVEADMEMIVDAPISADKVQAVATSDSGTPCKGHCPQRGPVCAMTSCIGQAAEVYPAIVPPVVGVIKILPVAELVWAETTQEIIPPPPKRDL